MGNNTKPVLQPQAQTTQQLKVPASDISKSAGEAYTALPNFEKPKNNVRNIIFLSLIGVLLIVGGYRYFSDVPVNNSRAPSAFSEHSQKTMQVSNVDFDAITTNQIQEQLQAGIKPKLLENSSPQIIEKLKSGTMKFYTFNVFDSVDEDGDVVEVSVDGLVLGFVPMSKAGTIISIPLEFGQSKTINIKAVRDGEGGVTLGIRLMNSEVMLSNMRVGENEIISLGYGK